MDLYRVRLEQLEKQLSECPMLKGDYSNFDLFLALDCLNRSIFSFTHHLLTEGNWQRQPVSYRQELKFSFYELARQGERLSDFIGISVSYHGRGYDTDIDALQHQSGIAQFALSMPLKSNQLDRKILFSLAHATLKTLLDLDVLVKGDKVNSHFNDNMEQGITGLERILQNAS